MSARAHLSEEAESEEREGRERLRATESKLRELRGRRDVMLTQVHSLSSEQRALFDARQPRQVALEAAHQQHRALGHRLTELKRERDAARRRLEEEVVSARLARQELAHGNGPRPEQLRREMSQLEHRQQTTALPLAEENALIDQMRELRRQVESAEKNATVQRNQQEALRAREEAVQTARQNVEHLTSEFHLVKVERDRCFASMQAQLLEVGRLVAEIREKARQRATAMERLDALMRDLRGHEREADGIVEASRRRRQEARRAIVEYNQAVRVSGPNATERVAEEHLEQLLKRGKVTLGG